MVNKVILIGNLGADPETRYTQGGTAVTNFRIATSETFKKDGEKVTETEWHSIVTWNKLAEICGEYLTKGSKVYLEGKLQTREWEDRDGNKRKTTEIVVRDMKMLGDKPQEHKKPEFAGQHGEPNETYDRTEPQRNEPETHDPYHQKRPEIDNDDVPF